MHKKKENLFPAFFATLFASGFAFFTSYGLGTLNPVVIIGLAMVLLLAFKQYGIELFSIKNKVAAIARLFFFCSFCSYTFYWQTDTISVCLSKLYKDNDC